MSIHSFKTPSKEALDRFDIRPDYWLQIHEYFKLYTRIMSYDTLREGLVCECGAITNKHSHNRHLRSKKHIKAMAELNAA